MGYGKILQKCSNSYMYSVIQNMNTKGCGIADSEYIVIIVRLIYVKSTEKLRFLMLDYCSVHYHYLRRNVKNLIESRHRRGSMPRPADPESCAFYPWITALYPYKPYAC